MDLEPRAFDWPREGDPLPPEAPLWDRIRYAWRVLRGKPVVFRVYIDGKIILHEDGGTIANVRLRGPLLDSILNIDPLEVLVQNATGQEPTR